MFRDGVGCITTNPVKFSGSQFTICFDFRYWKPLNMGAAHLNFCLVMMCAVWIQLEIYCIHLDDLARFSNDILSFWNQMKSTRMHISMMYWLWKDFCLFSYMLKSGECSLVMWKQYHHHDELPLSIHHSIIITCIIKRRIQMKSRLLYGWNSVSFTIHCTRLQNCCHWHVRIFVASCFRFHIHGDKFFIHMHMFVIPGYSFHPDVRVCIVCFVFFYRISFICS